MPGPPVVDAKYAVHCGEVTCRVGAWVRLAEAAGTMPAGRGVAGAPQRNRAGGVSARQEHDDPVCGRGRPAQGACERLAAEHPGAAWLVRWNRDAVDDPAGEVARLISDFVARFGVAPSWTLP